MPTSEPKSLTFMITFSMNWSNKVTLVNNYWQLNQNPYLPVIWKPEKRSFKISQRLSTS